ncbi:MULTISPECIES: hypothetical protein [Nostoc]|uniref:Uncharacterized protein n=1 Tax=Nostoc paludosum FACHB-159 TaxID=2692908 RepID=A0ABR8KLF1_9NOSO|nr:MULTISPECIES: hypothetical protein [Nostoc]MBD2682477.1 hypothetical protein [Nostoc sp. FACHB-857]MBD2738807.1 hypothetical protein [Nostoc paludosum FACHB-159]
MDLPFTEKPDSAALFDAGASPSVRRLGSKGLKPPLNWKFGGSGHGLNSHLLRQLKAGYET